MVEYFEANLWQFWIIIMFLCLILELTMGDFFIICFAIGALLAAVVSLISGFYVQLFVFAFVAALSIFFVRSFALRYLHRHKEERMSNVDALIGRIGVVTEVIKAGSYGRIAVDGDIWKAVSDTDTDIEVGERVEVLSLESITMKVKRVN